MAETRVYQYRPSAGGAQANFSQKHDTSHAAHQRRGYRSPLDAQSPYPKPGSAATRRDEDVASSPAERMPMGKTPFPANQKAGVTTIRGQHGPSGNPRDEGRG